MNDLDLDRLGDVWRQQPDPEEMARLQRTAAAVGRQARLGQLIDVGAALAVAVVVTLLVLSNPQTNTLLMGGAAILVLLVSQVRQRKLRQVELRGLAGGTEEMLDQSIERVDATLKRTRFSLFAIGPGFLIGWIFMNSVTDQPVRGFLPSSFDELWVRLLWNGVIAIVLVAVGVYSARSIRRGRNELERLIAMRNAYREERESTAP
jgi:TRAP-type C4-dicarboxylate transport system permease large subunit